MSLSVAHRFAALDPAARDAYLASLTPDELAALPFNWRFHARPDQLAPPGTWRTWMLLGGRGSGKTRSASEWVREQVETGKRSILGIIGPTADSIRRDQVEGPSGLLAVCPDWGVKPEYQRSSRRVVWEGKAVAHLLSAEEPDRIRGTNLQGAWYDEIAACDQAAEVWHQLQLALRLAGPLGDAPQAVVSTTPKNLPVLREILRDAATVVTRARTQDNSGNLDPGTIAHLMRTYGGTTLGRQELDGELVEDLEGALWTRQLIENSRVTKAPETLDRVVVAIDPAGGSSARSDETGIVVAAREGKDHAYVLADLSGRYSPKGWAWKAVEAYHRYEADCIVAEGNFGGEMVEATIRQVAPNARVKIVHASRGKAVRAEPVVALYEQQRVHHVGMLGKLEDQLCQWEPGVGSSPDRLDAMVWAITELMIERQAQPARWLPTRFTLAR